jgi:hypothetical protein
MQAMFGQDGMWHIRIDNAVEMLSVGSNNATISIPIDAL